MSPDLPSRIEMHLLAQVGWVSSADLERTFEINERDLRGDDGLLSGFAISGQQGYRHVRCATEEEFDRSINRLRSHANSEHRRVWKLLHARTSTLTGKPPEEKFTGQKLLCI